MIRIRRYHHRIVIVIIIRHPLNPSTAKGRGKITPPPPADLLAAISEPNGTIRNALVIFPKYGPVEYSMYSRRL